jgi:hypothetical protein
MKRACRKQFGIWALYARHLQAQHSNGTKRDGHHHFVGEEPSATVDTYAGTNGLLQLC